MTTLPLSADKGGGLAAVDLICGGFPCQDVSSAGKRAGLTGARSGLWIEYRRLISELSPTWVVVENVASGAKLWVDFVRADLAELGYDSLPIPLSAQDVGAPHRRERIFIVAHANGEHVRDELRRRCGTNGQSSHVASDDGNQGVACDSNRDCESTEPVDGQMAGLSSLASDPPHWETAPEFRGMDDGLSVRLDRSKRLKALGNAVVPQCTEVVGHVIRKLSGL